MPMRAKPASISRTTSAGSAGGALGGIVGGCGMTELWGRSAMQFKPGYWDETRAVGNGAGLPWKKQPT